MCCPYSVLSHFFHSYIVDSSGLGTLLEQCIYNVSMPKLDGCHEWCVARFLHEERGKQ